MKFTDKKSGKIYLVTWLQRVPGCTKCRQVNVAKSASFIHACALGSRLLMEHVSDKQRPVEKDKSMKILGDAIRAGVFVISKEQLYAHKRWKERTKP